MSLLLLGSYEVLPGVSVLHALLLVSFLATFLFSISSARVSIISRVLGTRKARTDGSLTPPRSLSPQQEEPGIAKQSASAYADVFPPHRRAELAECQPLPSALSSKLSEQEPDYSQLLSDKEPVPNVATQRITATGFSVDEIRRLGSFPDYACLSGVPLPEPYHEFNIDKAKPRPYRPLRWAYHQTMCKSLKPLYCTRLT